MVRELAEKLPVAGEKCLTPGDGEFIVASWIPLLSIRFRDPGRRTSKEAHGSLDVGQTQLRRRSILLL